MTKHRCIYCLEEKEASDFNREHVVPRMMGTYQNGFVLNEFQVCEECNSYFSIELENSISLNSFESFLRMQYGRSMSDGRFLKSDRVSVKGTSGLFKGLNLIPVVDKKTSEKIHFDISQCVGIMSENNLEEYNYYSLQNLPYATKEITQFLKQKERGIITIGIDKVTILPVLKEKGYIEGEYSYKDTCVYELYNETSFNTNINFSIDPIVRRICAKTVFNYLCYVNKKEYVLSTRFDEIRKYIRYGIWSDNLWFKYSKGPVSSVTLPNNTSHAVGYMFYPENKNWILCGCLTWFGEITYVFKIGATDLKIMKLNTLPCTKMACFNNVNSTIEEDEAVYIYKNDDVDIINVN